MEYCRDIRFFHSNNSCTDWSCHERLFVPDNSNVLCDVEWYCIGVPLCTVFAQNDHKKSFNPT